MSRANSPKGPPAPIPHPSATNLALIEEAAFRGTLRAIEMLGIQTAMLNPRILHRKKGYSAKRIATEIGHAPATIYRIEKGISKSLDQDSIEICRKIARLLGYPEDFYLQVVQEHIDRRWNR